MVGGVSFNARKCILFYFHFRSLISMKDLVQFGMYLAIQINPWSVSFNIHVNVFFRDFRKWPNCLMTLSSFMCSF